MYVIKSYKTIGLKLIFFLELIIINSKKQKEVNNRLKVNSEWKKLKSKFKKNWKIWKMIC